MTQSLQFRIYSSYGQAGTVFSYNVASQVGQNTWSGSSGYDNLLMPYDANVGELFGFWWIQAKTNSGDWVNLTGPLNVQTDGVNGSATISQAQIASPNITVSIADIGAMQAAIGTADQDLRQAMLWIFGAILGTVAAQHLMFHRRAG